MPGRGGKTGLVYFFLPKSCSKINPIELEWQHLKNDELAGKMFNHELEFAYAVIDGVQAFLSKSKLQYERIKFHANMLVVNFS